MAPLPFDVYARRAFIDAMMLIAAAAFIFDAIDAVLRC